MGGDEKRFPHLSYEDVSYKNTGYAEVVQITFNPKKISYKKLLGVFWNIHDPTTKDRQGPDAGSQYNSAIFYHNDKQRRVALKSKEERQKKTGRKIVTMIKKAPKFWAAEKYHQKYMEKQRRGFFKF